MKVPLCSIDEMLSLVERRFGAGLGNKIWVPRLLVHPLRQVT